MLLKDEYFMKIALENAKKGCGFVNPNPMVGAVIVKDDIIVGEGYHEVFGGFHAERNALNKCGEKAFGGTLYVTLEPCCHYGKTPPCTDIIIESGIKRVVIGSFDPNPLVAGKGAKILEDNGIEVTEGVLKEECDKMNEVFLFFIKNKIPYVTMKYAMTMDGKIASYCGKSKWITGDEARLNVQKDRHRYSGIMVGTGTVFADNPMLTCRQEGYKSPIRIICDTSLKTPLDSNVVKTAKDYTTIIATCCEDESKIQAYKNTGCEVISVTKRENYVDLKELMKILGERGIDSILLEGGGELNWSALKVGIVKKVQAYISPKLMGGKDAKSPIGGVGAESPNEAFKLSTPKITVIGEDILLESEVL